MKLTAKQIEAFEKITTEKYRVNMTMMIALDFHKHSAKDIFLEEKKLCDELVKIHHLDTQTNTYELNKVDGSLQITKVKKAQND